MQRAGALLYLCFAINAAAQTAPPAISVGEAIDHTIRTSSLIDRGKPFHAVLTTSNPNNAASAYNATVEVFWNNKKSYRTVITSPTFSQTRIVQGDAIEEHNTGDFYPPWLQNYVTALLNPLHLPNAFQNATGQIFLGEHMRSCIRHEDKPGGITNDLTYASICFAGNQPHLDSMTDFTYSMSFSDYQPFEKKQIPRAYEGEMDGRDPIIGRFTTLEPLANPNPAIFTITTTTPPAERIETTPVSTLQEESMLEHADNSPWPPVRDGKAEGYMIVYAVTDRTGQVRSAHKYNSDNAELEDAGVARALHYKFKPLLIDGVPQQMAMPLVLHFSSRIADPKPIVTGDTIKDYVSGCGTADLPTGLLPKGTPFHIRYLISEEGKVYEESFPEANDAVQIPQALLNPAWGSLRTCHFHPYLRDGKPTEYFVLFTFTAP
jgi:hypothetical protein